MRSICSRFLIGGATNKKPEIQKVLQFFTFLFSHYKAPLSLLHFAALLFWVNSAISQESIQTIVQPEPSGTLSEALTPERTLENILLRHWRPTSNDPNRTRGAIKDLARYFAQFDQVEKLLYQLDHYTWFFEYRRNEFSSEIRSGLTGVSSAKIYFDPYSAGQFKFQKKCVEKRAFCIARPADLLLHELLHLQLAFEDPMTFVADVIMNQQLYPYRHEHKAIDLERHYYSVMTTVDKLPRPLRTEHIGRPVRVACVTCLQ